MPGRRARRELAARVRWWSLRRPGVQVALGKALARNRTGSSTCCSCRSIWYGVAGTQRSGDARRLCLAGLLHDAWFEIGAFGVYGFKWTLIGWALAGLSKRLDLNHQGGRFVSGRRWPGPPTACSIRGLRRLLDLESLVRHPTEIVVQAVLTGDCSRMLGGSMVDRARGHRPARFGATV